MTEYKVTDVVDYYRNPQTETDMSKFEMSWTLTTIDPRQVDLKESQKYQNRGTGDVNADDVSRIAASLADPEAFTPPIVVRQRNAGTYVVADGNHRVRANLEAGRSAILAYVITCSDETFHQFTVFSNVNNAVSLSIEERNRQVIMAVKLGMPQTTVAHLAGISQNKVSSIIRAQLGEQLLRDAGVTDAHRRNDKAKATAAQLDVEHLQAIGVDVLREVTGAQMEAMVREILSAKPSQQLNVAKDVGRKIKHEQVQAKNPKARVMTTPVGYTPKRLANMIEKLTKIIIEKPSLLGTSEVNEAIHKFLKAVEGDK